MPSLLTVSLEEQRPSEGRQARRFACPSNYTFFDKKSALQDARTYVSRKVLFYFIDTKSRYV
jgi:hypothetical protein